MKEEFELFAMSEGLSLAFENGEYVNYNTRLAWLAYCAGAEYNRDLWADIEYD